MSDDDGAAARPASNTERSRKHRKSEQWRIHAAARRRALKDLQAAHLPEYRALHAKYLREERLKRTTNQQTREEPEQ